MSRGSVLQSLLAMVLGVALWCGDVAGQESNPPPVTPPSSGNPFEDEGPKTEQAKPQEEEKKDEEKKPAAKEEGEKAADEKKPSDEKKPDEEKVISEEVEPIVVPAPTPAKKPEASEPKGGDAKPGQPTPAKPEVEETNPPPVTPAPVKPAPVKPTVVDEGEPMNSPAVKKPVDKKPTEKQPVEAGKPVFREEPMPEEAERPAPLAPHHKSVPSNEAEIERSVYRAGDGMFHLAGEVGTAHYTGGDGKPCLAVLHLMGPSSPNPPFVLPAADANYRYYYQDSTCGDATVLAWAFQRPVCNSDGLWVMKYVRDASGKKSWVVHGGAQRTAIGCLKPEGMKAGGSDCQPAYDPPAPGEGLRPNPPAKKKSEDDLPVSPEIRFEPQEVKGPQGRPEGGRGIHFRSEE